VITPQLAGEMQETVFHHVLEQLAGADDHDTVRSRIVLEQMVAEIHGYQQPRPELIYELERLVANETTVGDLRARIRHALANLAAGAA
jgi:hypothetical protein